MNRIGASPAFMKSRKSCSVVKGGRPDFRPGEIYTLPPAGPFKQHVVGKIVGTGAEAAFTPLYTQVNEGQYDRIRQKHPEHLRRNWALSETVDYGGKQKPIKHFLTPASIEADKIRRS